MTFNKKLLFSRLKETFHNFINTKLKKALFFKYQDIKYSINFKKSHLKSYSQAGQDKFVQTILNKKKEGKYIEIGAYDPIQISNTYILEKDLNWTGFSLDIQEKFQQKFNKIRKNKCILADGTTFNYHDEIKRMWGDIKRIDYLQIDCEPAEITYKCLCALPLNKVRFSVITFETDVYTSGETIRELSRKKLNEYGYKLVASDVCNEGNPFEDWYVDPHIIDISILSKYICSFKEGKYIC